MRTTARGRAVFALVRDFVAELDSRLDERLGRTKVQSLRELLEELDDALRAPA